MIYLTNNKFSSFIKNPFDNNKPYDDNWILVKLIDSADFNSFTGNNGEGVFRFILTKQLEKWQYHLMDFLEYEESYNKNIIVAVNSDDLTEAKRIYKGHSYKDNYIRDYENPILVHTTTPEAYKDIIKSGCLKSWNNINTQNKGKKIPPIGEKLGDPPDYSDYIMFTHGGYYNELVVASKQKGYIEMNSNTQYIPGTRFYLDTEKIAKDGLLIRDGAHLKVKDFLELDKYLLWIATPEKVGLPNLTTPYEFGTKSDEVFKRKFKNYKFL